MCMLINIKSSFLNKGWHHLIKKYIYVPREAYRFLFNIILWVHLYGAYMSGKACVCHSMPGGNRGNFQELAISFCKEIRDANQVISFAQQVFLPYNLEHNFIFY